MRNPKRCWNLDVLFSMTSHRVHTACNYSDSFQFPTERKRYGIICWDLSIMMHLWESRSATKWIAWSVAQQLMIKIYDWSRVILLSMTKNVYCTCCYRRKSPIEMILKDHFNLRQWLFLCVWLTTCIMLICMLMIDVSGNVYVHALLVDIALPLAWAGSNLNMWLCVFWMARIALSVFKERLRRHGEAKDCIVRTLQHSLR